MLPSTRLSGFLGFQAIRLTNLKTVWKISQSDCEISKNDSEKSPESGAVKGTTFQAATYAIPVTEPIWAWKIPVILSML